MRYLSNIFLLFPVALLYASCATTPGPQPLTYLALARPNGPIRTEPHKGLTETFSRGGFYFVNYNFRPAADLNAYLERAIEIADAPILRNADIQLNIPFAFDLFFFGFNNGTDTVTAK